MYKKILFLFIILLFSASILNAGAQKRAVLIIPQSGFDDNEMLVVKGSLEKAGVSVKVASESTDVAAGMQGLKVEPQITFFELYARDFDAVIFIGGMGSSRFWNDARMQKIAQDAFNNDRIVAAISDAPVILARAGILNGRRATIIASQSNEIVAGGGIYTSKPVETDDNIITAYGPQAAYEFALEIIKALQR